MFIISKKKKKKKKRTSHRRVFLAEDGKQTVREKEGGELGMLKPAAEGK